VNVASSAYHTLHITQLRATNHLAPTPQLEEVAERFEQYAASPVKRTRAFARKSAFRMAVPRGRMAAEHSVPAPRSIRSVVVLCYHAVSERWPATLSVTPARLEQQLRLLLSRGYRGARFSDAVTGPATDRTLVVTFDDAYRSVAKLAFPVLSRLGLPGTVFAPSAHVGTERPMSWPGVEHWLGGEYESELVACSWDELRDLAGRGWEIGSHTCTHARLTQLDDLALAAELRESRAKCEAELGRECRSLAYPYGDYDDRVEEATREAGYLVAATLPSPWHAPQPLAWPRVYVGHDDALWRFRLKVSPGVRRLQGPAMSVLRRRPPS
jgi:peptidoglycan/xylan/chitin deacetylase (PgdA/CDA1 family)